MSHRLAVLALAGWLLLATTLVWGAEETNPMETFQDQLRFFNDNWPAMQQAVEAEGAPGVVAFISEFNDDLERRVLYMFANKGLVYQEWKGKSLETYIAVADAGIAEFLRQAAAADDDETRMKRTDGANVLSYNLSADLADCWPGDETVRSEAEYLRGLKAAEDCIAWRTELAKPPAPFSMAQEHARQEPERTL